MTSDKIEALYVEEGTFTMIEEPKMSNWRCYLFGSRPGKLGIIWTPEKGQEPNWFWRWMQYICFGNKWVKIK